MSVAMDELSEVKIHFSQRQMKMSVLRSFHFVFALLITVSAYPYELEVTDVGAESVVLKWCTTEKNVEEFKIHCSGIRRYLTAQREPHSELDVLTHFVPGSVTHLLMGDVQPNYNYSCMVSEQLADSAQVLGNKVSDPFHFATDYTAPEQPRPPVIHQQNEQYRIELFSVSSKYGPILGYKVQFHVVIDEAPDGTPILLHEEGLVPFGEFAPPSQSVALNAHGPKSFQLSFGNDSMPRSLYTDHELLSGALKSNVKYSAVTIAFSKTKRQMKANLEDVLFSVSGSSLPFLAKGGHSKTYGQPEPQSSSVRVRPAQLAIAVSLGVILPLLIISWVILVAVLLLCRAKKIRMQLRKAFTREDVIEANKLRKAQRNTDMAWLQPPEPMGDLPWLDPEYNHESIDQTQSTPTLHVPSQASPAPSRYTSKSLIEFSPDITEPERELMINRLKGYTLSEPTRYDISNFHENSTPIRSPDPKSHHSTYQPRDQDKRYRSSNVSTSSIQSNRSLTRYYSVPDFSTETSSPEQLLGQRSSSSVFLPRGLSAGPQTLVPRRAPQSSPIQVLLNQLSGGESGQEDLAPDMEMDMFDISLM